MKSEPEAKNATTTALSPDINILKVRDNPQPILIKKIEDKKFKICDESDVANYALKDVFAYDPAFGPEGKSDFDYRDLRKHIEPWLTSLFQSEHFSLLAGSGLTTAVHILASSAQDVANMNPVRFPTYQAEIDKAAQATAIKTDRKEKNIEDQFRIANELLRGLEILGKNKEAEILRTEITDAISAFTSSISKSEMTIANADSAKREKAFNALVTFLMSFASRSGTRDRLNIFTTNYDRLIEAGAELAGLHLLDRFVGQLMPVFRSSRLDLDMHYNPPGIRGEPRYLEGVARFTKLHGSLDWVQAGQDIRRIGLPFGAEKITP